jgi:nicotinamide-nucleotide amidase
LLSGSSVDTNSAYLSEKLLSIGIPTVAGYTVRDDCEAIAKALRAASEQADIVLTTGGLGPTDDDVTRQAISKFCTRQLKLNESLVEQIEQFFARRGKEMPQRNRVQAYLPDGAEALNNEVGTAPGIMLVDGEKMLFAMPGVPAEMKLMFEQSVLPRLTELDGREVVAIRKLKCFGMGESSIAELLGDRMQRGRNPLVNTTVRDGVITLHITAAAKDQKQAGEMAKREQEELTGILRDVVFATEDITLAQAVGIKLTKLKKTVAVAESCTGGLVGKLLTDVPGSSNYFICGWVVYSNTA